MPEDQSTRHVLMVRPVRFFANEQTAASNRFQDLACSPSPDGAHAAALAEFNGLVAALRDKGVHVLDFDDTPEPATPDSLFPNNWVSFHADGTAVLYPMMAPSRRLERRMDILESLTRDYGFRIDRVVDLTAAEGKGRFLEGTGSMVLDRRNRIAYACLSPRTDAGMVAEFGRRLGYEPVCFTAVDRSGHPIYHTNVMMSIGSRYAAVCLDSVIAADRAKVANKLTATGRDVIDLSPAQLASFAVNVLEVRGTGGAPLLALSAAALASLDDRQKNRFVSLGLDFVAAPLPTIERLGGGSARCMIAEVLLPHEDSGNAEARA